MYIFFYTAKCKTDKAHSELLIYNNSTTNNNNDNIIIIMKITLFVALENCKIGLNRM